MSSGESNRDPLAIRGDRGADQRGRFRRWAIGLVLAAAALIVAAMVGVRYFATEEPAAESRLLAPSVPLAASRAPPALRPTISLPDVEAEATAEALQRETREVANRLRDRWPDSPEALHVAAIVHAMLRETAEAERLWQRSIELDPRGTQYYVNLAAIAIDRGNSELARATLQQALDKGCTSADVYHHLALALTNLGRCEEAAEVAAKGLAAYPDSAGCWRMLGESQLKLGKAAEAEASLRQAINRGSSSASAYFALANACARQGKREEAAEFRKLFAELKAAEPIDPQQRYQVLTTAEARRNAVAALWEAATICAWKDDLAEAEKLLLRALAIEPARADFLRALSAIYRNQGRDADTEVVLQRLVELDPQDLGERINLARMSARLGKFSTAEAIFKKVIDAAPNAAAAYEGLARLYLEHGKLGEARWHAEEAARWAPTSASYRLLADICRRSGDTAAAAAAAAEALERSTPKPQPESAAAPRQTVP